MFNFKSKFILFFFGLFFLSSSVFAETLSGSEYTMEGGVVYQAGTIAGSEYSVSGSGESLVGISSGSEFSQNNGVYAPVSTGGFADPAPSGSGQSFGNKINGVDIFAYSYLNQTLTFVVKTSSDVSTIFILDEKGKRIDSSSINTISNSDLKVVIFKNIPLGAYTFYFKNQSGGLFFNSAESLFTIKINKEGNGIVNGPDSSIKKINDLSEEKVEIEEKEESVKTNPEISEEESQRSIEVVPVNNSSKQTCFVFGHSCFQYIKVYIFFVIFFIVLYVLYRYTKKIILKTFK